MKNNRNRRLTLLEERLGTKRSLPPFISFSEEEAKLVYDPQVDLDEQLAILRPYGIESFRELSAVKIYVGVSPDDLWD